MKKILQIIKRAWKSLSMALRPTTPLVKREAVYREMLPREKEAVINIITAINKKITATIDTMPQTEDQYHGKYQGGVIDGVLIKRYENYPHKTKAENTNCYLLRMLTNNGVLVVFIGYPPTVKKHYFKLNEVVNQGRNTCIGRGDLTGITFSDKNFVFETANVIAELQNLNKALDFLVVRTDSVKDLLES